MKFNLKAIAAAVALVATGSANAAFQDALAAGGSSLVVVAFNAVTNAYYVRDTGFILNTFLPNSVTTASGDGGVTGDKTPEAGQPLSTISAGDITFATWLAGQAPGDVRWTAVAADASSAAGTANVSRITLAISNPGTFNPDLYTNNSITSNVTTVSGFGGVAGVLGAGQTSGTGPTIFSNFLNNLSGGVASLGLLNVASDLYYFARSQGTLANATPSVDTHFGNSLNFAKLTLESDGDLTYSLAPAEVAAVPVPAAAWLLATGLIGLGGVMRRRKEAALA